MVLIFWSAGCIVRAQPFAFLQFRERKAYLKIPAAFVNKPLFLRYFLQCERPTKHFTIHVVEEIFEDLFAFIFGH